MLLLLGKKRFNPRSLPNLQLWLPADRINQANNTAVATWADQSGNGYDATQGTSAARPTYIASGLNGLPVVRFDGTDDQMTLGASALGMLRNVAGATVFVVAKYVGTASNRRSFAILRNGDDANRLALFKLTTNVYQIGGRRLDTDSFQGANSTTSATDNFILHTNLTNYQSTLLQQYVNGSLDGQSTSFQTSGNTSDTDSSAILVGSTTFNGDIAEIIVYNRVLNTSELAQVHRYLARKWGIALA